MSLPSAFNQERKRHKILVSPHFPGHDKFTWESHHLSVGHEFPENGTSHRSHSQLRVLRVKQATGWHVTPCSSNGEWIDASISLGLDWRRKWGSPDHSYDAMCTPDKSTRREITHHCLHRVFGHICRIHIRAVPRFDSTAKLSFSASSWTHLKAFVQRALLLWETMMAPLMTKNSSLLWDVESPNCLPQQCADRWTTDEYHVACFRVSLRWRHAMSKCLI